MYNRNTRIRFEIEKNKVPRSDDILDMFINPHFHRDKVSEESVSSEQRTAVTNTNKLYLRVRTFHMVENANNAYRSLLFALFAKIHTPNCTKQYEYAFALETSLFVVTKDLAWLHFTGTIGAQ